MAVSSSRGEAEVGGGRRSLRKGGIGRQASIPPEGRTSRETNRCLPREFYLREAARLPVEGPRRGGFALRIFLFLDPTQGSGQRSPDLRSRPSRAPSPERRRRPAEDDLGRQSASPECPQVPFAPPERLHSEDQFPPLRTRLSFSASRANRVIGGRVLFCSIHFPLAFQSHP